MTRVPRGKALERSIAMLVPVSIKCSSTVLF
jgi:hypothetical protein